MKLARTLVSIVVGVLVFIFVVTAYSILSSLLHFKASDLGALLGTALMIALAWVALWCSKKAGKWAGSKIGAPREEGGNEA